MKCKVLRRACDPLQAGYAMASLQARRVCLRLPPWLRSIAVPASSQDAVGRANWLFPVLRSPVFIVKCELQRAVLCRVSNSSMNTDDQEILEGLDDEGAYAPAAARMYV